MKKLLILFGLAVFACNAKSGTSISARLATSDGQPLPADGGTADAGNGIEITRVRIAIRRLRLESKDRAVEVKIEEGPLLLDAKGETLAGALVELITANVPAGTYDKLKIDIHPVELAPGGAFEDLVDQRASVIIEGTVDGKAFTFVSSLEAELELERTFTVGGGGNITLDVDASKWFKAADGTRLDPSDPANRLAIQANIRASFRAFDDDDEDGVEDHHGRDGGDDDGHDGGDDHHDGGDDHGGGDGGSGGGDGGSGHG